MAGEAEQPPTAGAAPPARRLVRVLAACLCVLALLWAAGVPRMLRLVVYTEQYLALTLALTLALVFLHVPARGRRRASLPWYDAAAAVAGFLAAAYVAVRYPALVEAASYDPSAALVYGSILLVLILEALRRTAGPALTIIVGAFIVYGLLGHLVPGRLAGRSLRYDRMLADLTLDPNALFGTPMLVAASIVVAFVFFGHLLNRSGGGAFFTDVAMSLMGRFRGGGAKISVVASSLFGSISGSAVSNVVSTGVVTIPLMRRTGYPAHVAAAIEAVASTGGQLMPPIMGASAFLMAEFLQIGYDEVVLAALMPAVLYYAALFIQADLRAAQAGITALPAAEIPRLWPTFTRGWAYPLPFVVLIVALFSWHVPPEEAALYAAGTLAAFGLVMGFGGQRLRPGDVAGALADTGLTVVEIIIITAAAGLIIGVLNFSGFSFGLTLLLVDLGSESAVALLVVAALICIVLGMGMPTIGVYVLLAALVAPALVKLGIAPKAAHLFVLYFGMMSMITPPVAIAAFAAATVAGAPAMRAGFEAVRFGWPAYVVPFLFAAAPSLLLIGSFSQVLLAACSALAGVWLVSIGVIGFLVRPLGWPTRAAFAASGLALMVPAGAFPGALASDLAGLALGAALTARELAMRRRAAGAAG